MIGRKPYLRKIRELGYGFKRQADRVALYRKPGETRFASVPRKGDLDEAFVRVELLRMGMSEEEVESFITGNRA